ncbi:MAG: hypothetical protein N2V75_03875 [Methanophagales archaeon]|nr:hypothetical protein [Methanophagales archaeon]
MNTIKTILEGIYEEIIAEKVTRVNIVIDAKIGFREGLSKSRVEWYKGQIIGLSVAQGILAKRIDKLECGTSDEEVI